MACGGATNHTQGSYEMIEVIHPGLTVLLGQLGLGKSWIQLQPRGVEQFGGAGNWSTWSAGSVLG